METESKNVGEAPGHGKRAHTVHCLRDCTSKFN